MYNVLIVDDEAPIRGWLEYCIQKIPKMNVVATAANGIDGYELFCREKIDIIFADISMPGQTGLEMMESIHNLNPSIYSVFLTSHSNFDYARKAMLFDVDEYILKTEITEETLHTIIDSAIKKLNALDINVQNNLTQFSEERNTYLRSLLTNVNLDSSELLLDRYSLPINKQPLVSFTCEFDNESPTTREMKQFLRNNFSSLEHLFVFSLNQNTVQFFSNFKNNTLLTEQQQFSYSIEILNLILHTFTCRIGMSHIYHDSTQLKDALNDSYTNLSMKFYDPEKSEFYNYNVNNTTLRQHQFYEKFEIYLLNQDYKNILDLIYVFIETIAQNKPTNIRGLKNLIVNILSRIIRLIEEDVTIVEQRCSELERSISYTQSFKELTSLIHIFFQSYSSIFNNELAQYSKPLTIALQYIQRNYMHSITLSDVAQQAYISPEYMSKLFKKELGLNYIVYLNNVRLKQAIYLLEHSNKKIYEIAEIVGYSNISYFSTVFKKNIGVNPFEYTKHKNSLAKLDL